MELKEPIALDDTLDFCDIGNRLALDYLRISRDVLQGVATGDDEAYLKSRVTNAFEALLSHARHCPHCKQDWELKRKGEIPFETSPPAVPIFEDLVRKPDHDIVIPEFVGTCELASAFPCCSVITGVARAF